MAVRIADKLAQLGGGVFKLIDAKDVEMADGSDLQSNIDILESRTSYDQMLDINFDHDWKNRT